MYFSRSLRKERTKGLQCLYFSSGMQMNWSNDWYQSIELNCFQFFIKFDIWQHFKINSRCSKLCVLYRESKSLRADEFPYVHRSQQSYWQSHETSIYSCIFICSEKAFDRPIAGLRTTEDWEIEERSIFEFGWLFTTGQHYFNFIFEG